MIMSLQTSNQQPAKNTYILDTVKWKPMQTVSTFETHPLSPTSHQVRVIQSPLPYGRVLCFYPILLVCNLEDMRQITKLAVEALMIGRTFKRNNTRVTITHMITPKGESYVHTELILHGSTIATYSKQNGLCITNAGYSTTTTKERLSALPNVHLYQKNFIWYLNGEPWNGEWVKVFSHYPVRSPPFEAI